MFKPLVIDMHAFKPHKLTIEEYFSIGEPKTKTELINGVIYDKVPPGPNHSFVVSELTKLLILSLKNIPIRQEQPLQFYPDNVPQPDIVILKPDANGYREQHPKVEDALAIIEVSDSSLSYDSNEKMCLYASGGVPYYFIVDLNNKVIIRYTKPENGTYQMTEKVESIQVADMSVDILPEQIF